MADSRIAPEDALVVAEVFRRLRDLVADLPARADGAVNGLDLYHALGAALTEADEEAHRA